MAQQANFNKLVLLKGFSTYFDRKIFFYSNVSDYETASTGYYEQEDINFNPNDGIDTSVDLSSLDSDMEEAVLAHSFSYILVLDANEDIVSRWYIMDIVRQTNGIYRFVLRRDVIGEAVGNGDFLNKAPIYVQKAHLAETDPMIVNDEGMRFNQIKKEEILLKDHSALKGWIIGYYESGTSQAVTIPVRNIDPGDYTTLAAIATDTGIDAADLSDMTNNPKFFATSNIKLTYGVQAGYLYRTDIDLTNSLTSFYTPQANFAWSWSHLVASMAGNAEGAITFGRYFAQSITSNPSTLKSNIQTILQNEYPSENLYLKTQLDKLQSYDGKIISDSGVYYKLRVYITDAGAHPELTITKGENTFFDNAISYAASQWLANIYDGYEIYVNYTAASVRISLEELPAGNYKLTIPSSANSLIDAPYSMFAIPLASMKIRQIIDPGPPVVVKDTWSEIVDDIAIDLANRIATALGAKLYDLQILPYLPDADYYYGSSLMINTGRLDSNKDYALITDNQVVPELKGIILFPRTSKFSLTINQTLTMKRSSLKIESQTDMYRLVSPNHNGIFEFNLAKNGGSVDYFLVDCTYKPHNPFIRVTPQFNFLYGANYSDGRGLICGGDFSLSIISDPWVNYQLQNKNYSMAFSRDIINLDILQRQERFKEPFTLTAGALGAGAAGALTGAKVGGGYGAIAGAAVGLTAGAVGGALDARLNEERRAETKDLAIDRFNMSLGNIQAMPQSLARTSIMTNIFRIYPFIEYYTCTDEEVQALENKIIYDGMTVGRIGNLQYYMGGNLAPKYFKGELIRGEGLEEDNHYVATVYNELAKGVYI